MERIDRHFDKIGRKKSLNFAIFWAAFGGLYLGTAICGIIKYTKSGDYFGADLGYINAVIGSLQIFIGIQMIRAVVRRLVAEARSTQD